MKIESTPFLNAYKSDTTSRPLHSPHKAKSKDSGSIDKVDLSSGISIERINSLLTTEMGKKVDEMFASAGIEVSEVAGLDWSPEATATRIFDMSSGLFGVWRGQHPDMSEEEAVSSFEEVIRGAVDEGYSQAMGILAAADLKSQAKETAEETISLVHNKFDDFFEGLRANLQPSQTQEDAPS